MYLEEGINFFLIQEDKFVSNHFVEVLPETFYLKLLTVLHKEPLNLIVTYYAVLNNTKQTASSQINLEEINLQILRLKLKTQ